MLLQHAELVVKSRTPKTILTGTARSAAGQRIEGILIEVETKAQPPASAFVISGADGSFKACPPTPAPASDSLPPLGPRPGLRRAARAPGQSPKPAGGPDHARAEPPACSGKWWCRGAPITRSHDTLSYKVEAFASKQRPRCSDVLKKMPGVAGSE
ncbi:MAG: hypothetical protein WKG07_36200 [Hymenobacter sp.]